MSSKRASARVEIFSLAKKYNPVLDIRHPAPRTTFTLSPEGANIVCPFCHAASGRIQGGTPLVAPAGAKLPLTYGKNLFTFRACSLGTGTKRNEREGV